MFTVLHFVLIVIYAWPQSLSNPTLRRYAAAYVEPIFSQRWSMFAPCPAIDSKVYLKYKFVNGDSTDWFRPTQEMASSHAKFPALHYGELILAEGNLDYWLSVDLNEMGLNINDSFPMEKLDRYKKGYSYFKIRNYINGWANYLYSEPIAEGQIKFERTDVTSGEVGTFTLPTYIFNND